MVGCVGEPKGSPAGRPVTPTLHSSPPLIGVGGGELNHLPEGVIMATQISISNITIHQDAEGRYSLNDLHKASGGEKRHQPSDWLRVKQTVELIQKLSIPGIPGNQINSEIPLIQPVTSRRGCRGGTYVCKELVYAYAMWISAAFSLKVIRAYDAMHGAANVDRVKPGPQRILTSFNEAGHLISSRVIRPDEHLATIAVFADLLQNAGYVVLQCDNFEKMSVIELSKCALTAREKRTLNLIN
ncbi:KilA-N domain [Klebsiella pneumoniae]|nr:KilA-N domain [Klebsiella pneumoniae]